MRIADFNSVIHIAGSFTVSVNSLLSLQRASNVSADISVFAPSTLNGSRARWFSARSTAQFADRVLEAPPPSTNPFSNSRLPIANPTPKPKGALFAPFALISSSLAARQATSEEPSRPPQPSWARRRTFEAVAVTAARRRACAPARPWCADLAHAVDVEADIGRAALERGDELGRTVLERLVPPELSFHDLQQLRRRDAEITHQRQRSPSAPNRR